MIFIDKKIEKKVHKSELAYYHKIVDSVISTRKLCINAFEKFIFYSALFGGKNSSDKDKLKCKKLYSNYLNMKEKYTCAVILYVSFLGLVEDGLL